MIRRILKRLDRLLKIIKQIFDNNESEYIDLSILLRLIRGNCSLKQLFIDNAIIELIKNDFFFIIDNKLKIKGYKKNY
jgi:hypothetical protein